ncbi:hypothetical protein DPM13_03565 [Paracoccus mutanolyticus]|uniref:Uncharacterized protein n=1 Tax=Paracoccus mutanolyticus TaxID=1499308 RepID=A0ABN5M421_9RHOB|nr:hypothetical protein DPM13_03565 [Paracoccus mutanolyticus]
MADCELLAFGIEFVDQLADNLDAATVIVEFSRQTGFGFVRHWFDIAETGFGFVHDDTSERSCFRRRSALAPEPISGVGMANGP